jgi:hypothetical protein
MYRILKEEFIKKYTGAPEEIQDIMGADSTVEVVARIEKINVLNIGQTGQLASLIGYVLVGLLHPKDLVPTIEKDLGVTQETAAAIAKEINENIFTQVKDILIETYNLNETPNQPTPLPPVAELQQTPGGYSTQPEMFEKKLQHSVIASLGKNTEIKKTEENSDHTTRKTDLYKELPE